MEKISWEQLPLVLEVQDLQRILKLGRVRTYELVKRKDFPAFRLGRKIRVPRDHLRAWVESQAGNQCK